MSANKPTYLTAAGLEKLKQELEYLRTTKRQEVAARLKTAISYGDLSENSEYDDAKNEQGFIEGRIRELERLVGTASVIKKTSEERMDGVNLGAHVTLQDLETGETERYEIVGTSEADPFLNRISNESPLGAAIMGKKAGAVVTIEAPAGELSYKLLTID